MWEIMPQSTPHCKIGYYTHQKQANSVAQVACRSLYEMFTGSEKIPVDSSGIRWRDQDVGMEVD